jgi:hypothetical protein
MESKASKPWKSWAEKKREFQLCRNLSKDTDLIKMVAYYEESTGTLDNSRLGLI